MNQPALGMNPQQRGFTLIEILVGVVILAVVAAAVALTLGRDRGAARLQIAAQRAQALITAHCRQTSILQGQLIGIRVEESQYQFVSQLNEIWQPLPRTRPEELAAGLRVWVSLDGRRAESDDAGDDGLRPQILCLPSGELTPFQLHFELADPRLTQVVHGRGDGQIEVGPSSP